MKRNFLSLDLISGLTLIFIVALVAALTTSESQAAEWGPKDDSEKTAFIGVYPENLDDEDREEQNFKGEGIAVDGVVDDGPAEKAGLEEDDIITMIDGEKVKDTQSFRETLRKHKPGDKVKVMAIHDGKEKEYSVELASRPSEHSFTFNWSSESDKTYGFLGVETQSIEDDFAEYFEVKHGALIERVVDDSPAEKAGLKSGDVLTKIGDKKIKETEDVVEAMRDHNPDEKVMVTYVRKGKEATVEVTLGKNKEHSSWNWSGPGRHRIIMTDEDEVTVDTEELREAIKEVLAEVKANLDDGRDELKQEMEQLKKELDQMKKEMEARKAEKKEEQKKN